MTGTQAPEAERTRLSRQAVVDRGLALADAGGLDKLTIRRLAQDLGVTPMALYWHFRSKEDLLTGLADQLWGEIDINVDASKPWSRQLRGLMESLIAVLRAHPSASQLLLEMEKQSEPALRATEYPRVVECAAELTRCDDPEFHYRFGIDLFIAGVEAVAATLT